MDTTEPNVLDGVARRCASIFARAHARALPVAREERRGREVLAEQIVHPRVPPPWPARFERGGVAQVAEVTERVVRELRDEPDRREREQDRQ